MYTHEFSYSIFKNQNAKYLNKNQFLKDIKSSMNHRIHMSSASIDSYCGTTNERFQLDLTMDMLYVVAQIILGGLGFEGMDSVILQQRLLQLGESSADIWLVVPYFSVWLVKHNSPWRLIVP